MNKPFAAYFSCFGISLVLVGIVQMLGWLQEHFSTVALVAVLVCGIALTLKILARRVPNTHRTKPIDVAAGASAIYKGSVRNLTMPKIVVPNTHPGVPNIPGRKPPVRSELLENLEQARQRGRARRW